MHLYYLRNKISGEVVTFYADSNDEGSWIDLDYGYGNPYFASKSDLDKIAVGHVENSWSVGISDAIITHGALCILEVCEVTL